MENQSPINYTIEALPEIFAEHAQKNEEIHAEQVKTYLEISSHSELPDHMKNPFNISRALQVICEELRALKQKS